MSYPRVELHVHLDGAIPSNLFTKYCRELGVIDDSISDEAWINQNIMTESTSLLDALARFDLLTKCLQTKENLVETVSVLLDNMYKEGIRLAELRFAPQLHCQQKLTQKTAIEAVLQGKRINDEKHPDMVTGILLCMMNNEDDAANALTVEMGKEFLGKGVVGIDLAGAEGMLGLHRFDGNILHAKELGVPYTIHAGESQGPEYVAHAMELGATRIGHGIHAWGTEEVVKQLIEKKVTLEVSVTSNYLSHCVDSFESHPIKKLMDAGVLVNINTDDPGLMGIDLQHEYDICKKYYGMTDKDFIATNLAGARASFCPGKEKIVAELEKALAE